MYREPRGPLDLRVRRRVGRLHPGEMLPQPGGPGPAGGGIRHTLPTHIRAFLHAHQVEDFRRGEKDHRLLNQHKKTTDDHISIDSILHFSCV